MMSSASLLDVALRTVYYNFDKYDKDLVKTIFEPVQQKMLDKILKMDEHHYAICDGQDNHIDKIWAMLSFLFKSKFHTELDVRDLTCMNCDCSALTNSRFQEFIRCLGANTPNMRDLTINRKPSQLVYSLEERELDSIVQLKNLAFLEIDDVRVPLSGILDISRRCKKLKRIRATDVIIDEELSSVAFRDDFAYIEIDFSRERMYLMMQTRMATWDPKYAAHTHYMKVVISPNKIADFSLVQGIAKKITEIEFVCLKLCDIEEMDEFLHLPHVKYARIHCDGKSAHALRCFMKRNGQSLQELNLREIDIKDKMTFGELFGFCPNLESLELNYCNLLGNDAPVDAMQQLKRFRWEFLQEVTPDAVAFSSVLSAPLLEELFIVLPNINFSDNATVIARIQRREILRNLKEFDMFEMTQYISEDYVENMALYLERFTELNNAITSLISA